MMPENGGMDFGLALLPGIHRRIRRYRIIYQAKFVGPW